MSDTRTKYSKPWLTEDRGVELEAYLGSRGYRTSSLATSEELIAETARVFEIEAATNVTEMAARVDALGKRERGQRANRNLSHQRSRPNGKQRLRGLAHGPSAALAQLVKAVIEEGHADVILRCPILLRHLGWRDFAVAYPRPNPES